MEKARYIVLTDIVRGIEIDDIQSMVRLLLYSNEIDIEGLIACSSCFVKKPNLQRNAQIIHRIIDAYGSVRQNLLCHAKGYPEAEYLHRITHTGIPCFGAAPGNGFADERYSENEGVRCILRAAEKDDPRPLWIGIWGGANTLAQAIWVAQREKTEAEFHHFLSKLRVYSISDQDQSGLWMRQQYGKDLFYIVSPTPGDSYGDKYYYTATWPGISADKSCHGSEDGVTRSKGFSGSDYSLVSRRWIWRNIRSYGSYGKQYPYTRFLTEGDTPSFLSLIPNGLSYPERPDYGGWGGRYELKLPADSIERFPIWTNASDTVQGTDGMRHCSPQATIWRWREAFQNDFAARMRWTVTAEFNKASHPPVIIADNRELTVSSGDEVRLYASVQDPDGSGCDIRWFLYSEAGTENVEVPELKKANREILCFQAPAVQPSNAEIHLILQATNRSNPPLSRYYRFIVKILAKRGELANDAKEVE